MIPQKFPLYLLVALLLTLAASATAFGDIIVLLDGTEHEGEVVRETPESVTLRVRVAGSSGNIVLKKTDISSIESRGIAADPVLAAGVALQKTARDAESDASKAAAAWARVGEYYGAHPGYTALSRAAFQKTLIFNSDHPVARAHLGFTKTPTGWAEPAAVRREDPVQLAAVVAPLENGMTIGLRRDEAQLRKLREEAARRRRIEEENARWHIEQTENRSFTSYGYARDVFYIGPHGHTYYTSGYGSGLNLYNNGYCGTGYGNHGSFSGGYSTGFRGHSGFGGYSGFSGYSGSRCGYGGYGLGVNFGGRSGSFQYGGSFFGGSHSSSSSGFIGGGFGRTHGRGRF